MKHSAHTIVKEHKATEPTFKMAAHDKNGNLRETISVEIFRELARKHGDIMRAISSNRWVTINEICEDVWRFEKRLKNPTVRTRRQVESALWELLDANVVVRGT
jgi:hypothetical protein